MRTDIGPENIAIRICFLVSIACFQLLCMRVSAFAAEFCWNSLTPTTGDQNTNIGIRGLLLASNGADEAWLSWEEDGPRILRWTNSRWSVIPTPYRPGTEEMHYPLVSTGPFGTVILSASANGKGGTRELHIARWTGSTWEWLGAPLISSRVPFTHARKASIAFWKGTLPVVAWAEERHVKLAGLFVARWDGSHWQHLGQLKPGGGDYRLSPIVVVDAANRIWLSWREGGRRSTFGSSLRVARWNGMDWHDMDPEGLRELTEREGFVYRHRLMVDSKGQAWVLWTTYKEPRQMSLKLARWNGTNWVKVQEPQVTGGKGNTVRSAEMILRDGAPTIAWSQSDDTDNHRLYIAEWMANDLWNHRMVGLHLVEGVSDVSHIGLANGDHRSVFISWDEVGKDKRRTRLIKAYTCGEGETPAVPPKSVVERDTWPKTVDEAARKIIGELDNASKVRVRSTKKGDLSQYHHGWGTGIRNSYGLWRDNKELLESCGQGKSIHPDTCSMLIIEAVWDLLQGPL